MTNKELYEAIDLIHYQALEDSIAAMKLQERHDRRVAQLEDIKYRLFIVMENEKASESI